MENQETKAKRARAVWFAVITRTPHDSFGNLAVGTPIYSVIGKDDHGRDRMLHLPAQLWLSLRTPVFVEGEILVLDVITGREISGRGRKPDKWDVEFETFATVEEAVERAKGLKKEETKGEEDAIREEQE